MSFNLNIDILHRQPVYKNRQVFYQGSISDRKVE